MEILSCARKLLKFCTCLWFSNLLLVAREQHLWSRARASVHGQLFVVVLYTVLVFEICASTVNERNTRTRMGCAKDFAKKGIYVYHVHLPFVARASPSSRARATFLIKNSPARTINEGDIRKYRFLRKSVRIHYNIKNFALACDFLICFWLILSKAVC